MHLPVKHSADHGQPALIGSAPRKLVRTAGVVLVAAFAGLQTAAGAGTPFRDGTGIFRVIQGGVTPPVASTPQHRRNVEVTLHFLSGNDFNGQLPPPIRGGHTFEYALPPGTVINARRLPSCNADALARRGAAACPAASRVGRGQATADARPLIPTFIPVQLELFNGKDRSGHRLLLALEKTTFGVSAIDTFRVSQRGSGHGPSFTLDAGPVPGTTSSAEGQGFVYSLHQFDVTFQGTPGRAGVSYLQAPRTCHGHWRFTLVRVAYDGTRSKAVDNTPCVGSRR